ncbi:MAG: DUF7448 domain-containing protein [Candidatus Pacearchaeota archaeon]
MYISQEEILARLIGKKVKRIFMNEDYLKFETDDGNICFGVSGGCCSISVFYDFYGVKKLLNNGKIKSICSVELTEDDKLDKKPELHDSSIEKYGFSIVTEDPEFGDVTSVFSFRNYSNGYYGGSLESADDNLYVSPEIFDDVIETSK